MNMRLSFVIYAFALIFALLPPSTFAEIADDALRIMPLGNSITYGGYDSNYRLYLWEKLQRAQVSCEFVGTLQGGNCAAYDCDHEGHYGWSIESLTAGVVDWLNATSPDMVLTMIGSNDMGGDSTHTQRAVESLSQLIETMRATAPQAKLFIASLPLIDYGWPEPSVDLFNDSAQAMIQRRSQTDSLLFFADVGRQLTTNDLADGIHPNDQGYRKMADAWFDAIRPHAEQYIFTTTSRAFHAGLSQLRATRLRVMLPAMQQSVDAGNPYLPNGKRLPPPSQNSYTGHSVTIPNRRQ
ncbi:MAG: hypothetical protein GF398_03490 [Chitinivibrionales bacterium]|nr:hypothetical protein [Chitinivibrionales bacterium]